MSSTINEMKKIFTNYLLTYEGKIPIPENSVYDESEILRKICALANENKPLSKEFAQIIKDNLIQENELKFKLKIFNVIDYLFKGAGEEYINLLSPVLYEHFKQCFLESNF